MADLSTDNLLQLRSARKSYGARDLFDDLSFSINENEHVGVIGPNGAGKTTLFRCILGLDQFDVGEVIRKRGLKMGYLSQHDNWDLEETVEAYVLRESQANLWEIKQRARILGLSEGDFLRTMQSLNGGMRMRAKLLSLLCSNPDLMFLDEPTNYLDLETVLLLENFLQSFKGAFLLISHDREFLRRTTDHILEVEGGEATKFNGGLDDYFEQKTMLRNQLQARAMSQAQRRQEILDFVNRFGAKATKARQAQSRLKSLEKMEVIDIKALGPEATIRIPAPQHCGKDIFVLNDATLGYPDRKVIDNCSLTIRNGEKCAVVGFNGAGKSTLLKSLAGRLPLLSGEMKIGYQVQIAYFAQHSAEELSPNDTVLEGMSSLVHPTVKAQEILDMAGSLLFSGDDSKKKISVLSGGEKSRVALGRMLLQRYPVLILDEPTNHLDFQTVTALASALKKYDGTVVFVSHDRSFVASVANKIVEVNRGQTYVLDGSYDDYVWSLTKGVLSGSRQEDSNKRIQVSNPATRQPIISEKFPESHEIRKARQKEFLQLTKQNQSLEKLISRLETEISDLLKDPKDHSHFQKISELTQQKEEAETEWMSVLARLEELSGPSS